MIKQTRGFKWGRKSKFRAAKEALLHAGRHAYIGRKQKKRQFRSLWITRLSAAATANGGSYSQLIGQLNKTGVKLNRKMLSEIAIRHPEVFAQIVKS
ncbi:MAG: 50S ribosomal protein L20 [Patescibacteria group bacterium]|nr:50S ribosomal protein L20 [Patescibacteria group bacterium]